MTSPFRRAADTARGAGAEAAALAHHLLRYPSGLGREGRPAVCPPRPVGVSPHDGPVLLLHGLADNRAVFTPLIRTLHRAGWTHLHTLNYSPLTVDVRAAAVLLARHVEWAARAHGGRPVALVGHSLGGLIARYYVQCLGGAELVPIVVTLATPHGGTSAARLPSPFPVVRQLRAGSDLLAELQQPLFPPPHLPLPSPREATPAEGLTATPTVIPAASRLPTRFTSLRAELDELILPGTAAWIHHPELQADNRLISGVGHVALPAHPATVAVVRQVLEAADGEKLTERHAC